MNSFDSRVDKRGPDDCWEWTAGRFKYGYGKLRHNGKVSYAHRVSYENTFGQIPSGMFVCHHCDNPACVNPAHLFLGSPADNMVDRDSKNRKAVGEGHGRSVLTEEKVIALRERRKTGVTYRELAEWLGVSHGCVYAACNGISWNHI